MFNDEDWCTAGHLDYLLTRVNNTNKLRTQINIRRFSANKTTSKKN